MKHPIVKRPDVENILGEVQRRGVFTGFPQRHVYHLCQYILQAERQLAAAGRALEVGGLMHDAIGDIPDNCGAMQSIRKEFSQLRDRAVACEVGGPL
jgi:hypothetical protein